MKNKVSLILASVFTALSAAASLAFCGYRNSFVFIDSTIHFMGFCYLLWALFILNTVCLFVQTRTVLKKKQYFSKPVFIANMVIGAAAFIVAFVIAVAQPNEIINYIHLSRHLLPYLGAFYALLFFILVFPHSGELFRKIVAAVAGISVLTASLVFLFPVGGFEIESAPAVFDTGSDYRVVFSTNRESIGCVTYEYNGESYTVWDTTTGRKDSSRVHSVRVPYEHINNNGYSVKAVRALEDIAYGGWLGSEATVEIDRFTPCPEDDFDMVCVTDTHGAHPDWSSIADSGDVYVYLGDMQSAVYSYDTFIDNLVRPAGEMTGGRVPMIFVRGNHDHRGDYVPALLAELDFDEYYYRIEHGKYTFTVFDSGEDKLDDHFEYGGYNDYVSYRAEQIEWARGLEKKDGYNVMLVHSPTIFDQTPEDIEEITNIVKDLGNDLIICGHMHETVYTPAEESDIGIQYYICGSRTSAKDINFTRMHFKDGHVSAKSVRLSTDEKLCEAEMTLKAS